MISCIFQVCFSIGGLIHVVLMNPGFRSLLFLLLIKAEAMDREIQAIESGLLSSLIVLFVSDA